MTNNWKENIIFYSRVDLTGQFWYFKTQRKTIGLHQHEAPGNKPHKLKSVFSRASCWSPLFEAEYPHNEIGLLFLKQLYTDPYKSISHLAMWPFDIVWEARLLFLVCLKQWHLTHKQDTCPPLQWQKTLMIDSLGQTVLLINQAGQKAIVCTMSILASTHFVDP